MLKYVETAVTFSEVPDEITLCINISNCPCHCKNCHSAYLAEDIGENLDGKALENLIQNNKGVTCVAFMGGDIDPCAVIGHAKYIKTFYPKLKVAWYSGRQELPKHFNLEPFNYVKLGPYIEEFGPLTSETTNQRFYKVIDNKLEDITYKFYDSTRRGTEDGSE